MTQGVIGQLWPLLLVMLLLLRLPLLVGPWSLDIGIRGVSVWLMDLIVLLLTVLVNIPLLDKMPLLNGLVTAVVGHFVGHFVRHMFRTAWVTLWSDMLVVCLFVFGLWSWLLGPLSLVFGLWFLVFGL